MKFLIIPLCVIGAYLGANTAIIVGMATFGEKVIQQAYMTPPGTSDIDQPSDGQTKVLPDFSVQRAASIQGTLGIE